jgi:hypothetical protein
MLIGRTVEQWRRERWKKWSERTAEKNIGDEDGGENGARGRQNFGDVDGGENGARGWQNIRDVDGGKNGARGWQNGVTNRKLDRRRRQNRPQEKSWIPGTAELAGGRSAMFPIFLGVTDQCNIRSILVTGQWT